MDGFINKDDYEKGLGSSSGDNDCGLGGMKDRSPKGVCFYSFVLI